jgi:SM-20-related protein
MWWSYSTRFGGSNQPFVSSPSTPVADLLAKLGIFRVEDFIEPSACRAIVAHMRSGRHKPAGLVRSEGEHGTVDEAERRARDVEVSAATSSVFEQRLLDVKPALEAHFGLRLGEPDKPQFLTYEPGGFQVPHRDVGPAARVSRRLVSAVLFVNGRSEDATGDGYAGGSLVLYGLLGSGIEHGIPVDAKAGQLVAFRSDVLHEVTPVSAGRRHTAVTWFPDPD